jgi:uncharacterized protein (TIGR00297 family)
MLDINGVRPIGFELSVVDAPTRSAAQIFTAIVVTLTFAATARLVRGVSTSGAIVGALISLALYVSAGARAFLVLVSVFLLTLLATRLGYGKKQTLGTAEKRGGRTASQVLANLAVAAVCAVASALKGHTIFLLGCVSALAEAAADTVSSEYGQAVSQQPRLITTWNIVPPGTDGAVSLPGTFAGIIAAVIVSFISASLHLLSWRWMVVSIGAATMGMLFDSLLGASFERRHWLDNDTVNFLSTLVAALLAVFLGTMLR